MEVGIGRGGKLAGLISLCRWHEKLQRSGAPKSESGEVRHAKMELSRLLVTLGPRKSC